MQLLLVRGPEAEPPATGERMDMDVVLPVGAALAPTAVAIRLALAFVVGACVGVERQWHHKNAGLRTHTLVAIGAAAFTIVSGLGLGPTSSPMLIAAGVVTGIGFIAGGVIMHDGHAVQGLNTAATLWATASLGLAAGGGYYTVTVMVFVMVLLVQFPLQLVERWIDRASRRTNRADPVTSLPPGS